MEWRWLILDLRGSKGCIWCLVTYLGVGSLGLSVVAMVVIVHPYSDREPHSQVCCCCCCCCFSCCCFLAFMLHTIYIYINCNIVLPCVFFVDQSRAKWMDQQWGNQDLILRITWVPLWRSHQSAPDGGVLPCSATVGTRFLQYWLVVWHIFHV